jgi:hypothetical protein
VGGWVIKAQDVWSGSSDLADRIKQEPDAIAAQQLIDNEVRRGLEELEKFAVILAQTVLALLRFADVSSKWNSHHYV